MTVKLLIEADGGSRGNPGPAGYGAVVKDAGSGEVLAELAEPLGVVTNNVAEYNGLVAGLRRAVELAPGADVEVRMDSKLVVEQMRGTWRVKHPDLQPLALDASRLARQLGRVTYDWVPRARNGHADRLANEAMDRQQGKAPKAAKRTTPVLAVDEVPDAEPPPTRTFVPAELGTPTRTVLVRHGETAASSGAWFNGHGDEPLTAHGREEAAALAAHVAGQEFDAIVSSPLGRARVTADALGERLRLPVREDKDLREVGFGRWEGLALPAIRDRYPDELTAWLRDAEAAPTDGESLVEVTRRASRARDKLVARFPNGRVLVVAHGMLIGLLVSLALGVPPETCFRMRLDTTGVSTVDWYPSGYARLVGFNDRAHLRS